MLPIRLESMYLKLSAGLTTVLRQEVADPVEVLSGFQTSYTRIRDESRGEKSGDVIVGFSELDTILFEMNGKYGDLTQYK